jgi:hypothetical protein
MSVLPMSGSGTFLLWSRSVSYFAEIEDEMKPYREKSKDQNEISRKSVNVTCHVTL